MEWSWASSALFSFTVSSFLLSLILSISCGLTAISNMTYNTQQFRKCTNSSEWITLTVTPRDPALVCADRLQQMLLCYNHHDDDADVMPLRWLSVEFSLGLWSFTRWEKSALLVSLLWTANREEKTADIAEMSHKFGWWSSSRPGDEAYCVCGFSSEPGLMKYYNTAEFPSHCEYISASNKFLQNVALCSNVGGASECKCVKVIDGSCENESEECVWWVYYPAGLSDHSVLIDGVLCVWVGDTLCVWEARCLFQCTCKPWTRHLVLLWERSTRGLEVTVCESKVLTAEQPEHKNWLFNIVPLKIALTHRIALRHQVIDPVCGEGIVHSWSLSWASFAIR